MISEKKMKKLLELYNQCAKDILCNVNKDNIKDYSSRKTLTSTTYKSQRTNETKIIEAVQGTDYREGDRIWIFFKEDNSLSLVEHYNGDYSKTALLKKLYDTVKIFENVLDKSQFLNYTLKRNQKLLEELK